MAGEAHFPTKFVTIADKQIAFRYRKALGATLQRAGGANQTALSDRAPGLVWLPGYGSDMKGDKALAVDSFAQNNGLSCLRFDYSGHGESEGNLYEGTISAWLYEALTLVKTCMQEPPILIGSSLGGWLALLLARAYLKENRPLAGIVLIAPAPDFTEKLILPSLNIIQRANLNEGGQIALEAGNPYAVFSKALFDDGRDHLVMEGILPFECPIVIMHGMEDTVVPYSHSLALLNHLPCQNVTLTLIRDGDHRLSRPEDLSLLGRLLQQMLGLVASL
ncbi:alpha/beta hydrolase [Bartonella sp. DGB2]|uniref:alpha/beta hydrolase n=1 Tax=Bartonella sp. DGB2 TaxID=3388426 RepID=UPI00398FBA10